MVNNLSVRYVFALLLCFVFFFSALAAGAAPDEVQTPSELVVPPSDEPAEEPPDEQPVVDTDEFTLAVSGRQTFGVRMGFGHPEALRPLGLSPWVPVLDQSLRADITGNALGFLTLEASFDDQKGPGFQHLLVKAERDPWTAELGDFFAGVPELGVYNKKLLGARLTYQGEGFTSTAVAARLQGISETVTFRGEAARAERLYAYTDPDQPWSPAPYAQSVLGLTYFRLRVPFVEGFSEVALTFRMEETVVDFLTAHDLGYLVPGFEAAPASPLAGGQFSVLPDEGDVLLLRVSPEGMMRRRIRDAINEYNTREGLTDEDRMRYPFVEGSELETEFLQGLLGYAHLEVDGEEYRFADARRRRYLALGERDVIEASLDIRVRRPGEDAFRPIDDPALADYEWDLFPERGILVLDFPDAFFAENAGLRVTFDYRREGNVFMLGLSVVPGSERVYLNGERLTRGPDYTVDYEVGMVILFDSLAPVDELRVEFERQRGALGVVTDYERGIFAVSMSVPGSDNLEVGLARAADIGTPRPYTPTMPNTHTVAGLRMSGDAGGWDYELVLGGSENVFPHGDSQRVADVNRINVVAAAEVAGEEMTVIGHQSGLTVYDGDGFSHYGPAQGLGGREVRDLLALPGQLLLATAEGLTVVRLEDSSPFDRVGSWVRLLRQHGYPGDEGRALAYGGGTVYLATEEALAWFAPRYAEEPEEWESTPLPEGVTPTALLWTRETVFLGAVDGLYSWDGESWEPRMARKVNDLAWLDGWIYVATPRGVRVLLEDGTGAGWEFPERQALSLAVRRGELWMAGPDGLFRHTQPLTPVVGRPLTAVGRGHDALWAGGAADFDYDLDLWRVVDGRTELYHPDVTHIEGRDLGSFRDIPAVEHTALGLSGRLSLSREVDDWRWAMDFSSRGSGYQEIGGGRGGEEHRATVTLTHDADSWLWRVDATTSWIQPSPGAAALADSHRLGFTVSYQEEGEWEGSLRAQWDLSEALTEPAGTLSAALDVSWAPGPRYSLSLTPKLTGEGWFASSGATSGYKLAAEFPGDTWVAKAALSGDLRAPDWFTAGKIEASTKAEPVSGWTVELSGFRPYRTAGSPGDQGADFALAWRHELDAVSWTATWKEILRNRIGSEDLRWERSLSGDLRFSTVDVAGAEIFPRLRLSWEDTVREDRWQVRLTGNIVAGDARWELSGTYTHAYRPAIDRTARSLSTNVRWEYTGWPGFAPSVNWQGSWELLSHPRYEEDRLTERHDVTARLSWEPEAAQWRNELTLSYRGRDDSYALTNRLTLPTDWGTLSGDAGATWRGGLLEGRLGATSGWRFGDMWELSGQLGYSLSYRPAGEDGPRHAVHAGVLLTASF